MSPLLDLPVRWGPMIASATPEEHTELRAFHQSAIWTLDTAETALVLVDVWDRHSVQSHMERALRIVAERIAPAVDAARRAGVLVVHAPSPEVARLYPQARPWLWRYHLAGARRGLAAWIRRALRLGAWPPVTFRRRLGRHARYARPRPARWREPERVRRVPESVAPVTGEPVVICGADLHRVLRRRRILHLCYAGFATNACVRDSRDYSMAAMRRRGYNLILLRDGTTGIETADTLAGLLATRVAVQEIEQEDASTTAEEFIRACAAAR